MTTLNENLLKNYHEVNEDNVCMNIFVKFDNSSTDIGGYKVACLIEKIGYITFKVKTLEVPKIGYICENFLRRNDIKTKIKMKDFVDPAKWEEIYQNFVRDYGIDNMITITAYKDLYKRGDSYHDIVDFLIISSSRWNVWTTEYANFDYACNREDKDMMKAAYGLNNSVGLAGCINTSVNCLIMYKMVYPESEPLPGWNFNDLYSNNDRYMLDFYNALKIKTFNSYLFKYYPSYKNDPKKSYTPRDLCKPDSKFRVQLASYDRYDPRWEKPDIDSTLNRTTKAKTFEFKNIPGNFAKKIISYNHDHHRQDFDANGNIRWFNPFMPFTIKAEEFSDGFADVCTECACQDFYYKTNLQFNNKRIDEVIFFKHSIEIAMRLGIGYTMRSQCFGINTEGEIDHAIKL